MDISIFSYLIRNLPVKRQCISSKYNAWSNTFGLNLPTEVNQIFNHRDEIKISREEILNENNLRKKIYMTIFWGYPKGIRNNYHQYIFNQIDRIKELLENSIEIENWNEHISTLNIRGLGLSTYSKFLYFNKSLINHNKAIILDKRIIKCINESIFDCFNTLNCHSDTETKNSYPRYLEIIKNIAEQNNVTEDQIEFFLFLFGNNIK